MQTDKELIESMGSTLVKCDKIMKDMEDVIKIAMVAIIFSITLDLARWIS